MQQAQLERRKKDCIRNATKNGGGEKSSSSEVDRIIAARWVTRFAAVNNLGDRYWPARRASDSYCGADAAPLASAAFFASRARFHSAIRARRSSLGDRCGWSRDDDEEDCGCSSRLRLLR